MSASPTTTGFDTYPHHPHGDPPTSFMTFPSGSLAFATGTPFNNQQQQWNPTQSSPYSQSTPFNANSPFDQNNNQTFWGRLGHSLQAAIILIILLGIFVIIAFSVWFYCGCCGLRRRRQKRVEARQQPLDDRSIPLNNVSNRVSSGQRAIQSIPGFGPRAEVPPPRYEEVVPASHQTIAGGNTHVREEDATVADGIVADGKTPLSEMTFEDVVLDRSNGEGSSRTFEQQHFGLGGDTRGHTNS